MSEHLFESSRLSLKLEVTGRPPDDPAVQFELTGEGQGLPKTLDATLEWASGGMSAEILDFVVPAVPDGRETYSLTARVKAGGLESQGDTYTVWPFNVSIEVQDKDSGQPFARFPFRIRQNGRVIHRAETNLEGRYSYQLREKAGYDIEAVPPYQVEWDEPKVGNKRIGKGTRTFAAEFLDPVPQGTDPLVQRVNLPGGRPGRGQVVKIRVGAKDDRGVEGDKIFVHLGFERHSLRSEPVPQPLDLHNPASSDGGLTWTGELRLGKKGAPAEFQIDLGLGGGDTCQVKIASTLEGRDGAGDAVLRFENWRQLYYELLYPDALVPELTEAEIGDARLLDFPDAVRSKIQERLAAVFIAYGLVGSHSFRNSLAPAGSMVSAAHFPGSAGGPEAFVLSPAWAEKLPNQLFSSQDPRCIKIRLCHRLFDTGPAGGTLVSVVLDAAALEYSGDAGYWFEERMDGAGRALNLQGCQWKALVGDVSQTEEGGLEFVDRRSEFPEHPGLEAGAFRTGPVPASWFRLGDCQTLAIELPGGSEPGNLVGKLSAQTCPILLQFKMEPAVELQSASGRGTQIIALNPSFKPGHIASVVCHELAHAMGLSVMPGWSAAPPGTGAPKHVDGGGTYYASALPGQIVGQDGVRAGPRGAHCAHGLDDQEKAKTVFEKQGDCILFAAGGPTDNRPAFCEDCAGLLKARKLEDLRSPWPSRPPADG